MKKTNYYLLVLSLFMVSITFGQNCNCPEDFKWLKKTFEENDAGYQYVIDQKGINAYKNHSKEYLKKATSINDVNKCADLMNKWTEFFRSGHISIGIKNNNSNVPTKNSTIEWDKAEVNHKKFLRYLKNKSDAGFEGIWQLGDYKVGIKKENKNYIGFIIEAKNKNWKKNFIKFIINEKQENEYDSDYYMGNFSKIVINDVKLLDDNTLKLGSWYLNRLNSKFTSNIDVVQFLKLGNARKPLLERLNNNTLILRIPTFNYSEKKHIDSLILANKAQILNTKNLIIDIRNNGGGSDVSYREIIPLLYTNPIRVIGVEYLSTKLNNQRMQKFIDGKDYSDNSKKWAKESLVKLNANIGKFVNLRSSNSIYSVRKLDTVHAYPKNVGILINNGNGSTSEQFLLAAKQSKKVKLFGTTTYGVLDISNMHILDFPSNQFTLGYSLSKSMRIPDMTIDSKGIQPDYYIDKSIPDYKWINFVSTILDE